MSKLALKSSALALPLSAASFCLTYAPEAQACGGTFCDTGPQVMPVDQTGENILFVREGGRVEAHIQIQYDGDPERFAWVIPVTALPEVRVSSQALFDNMLAATVPSFAQQSSFDCQGDERPGWGCGQPRGGFLSLDSAQSGGSDGGDPSNDGGGGPEVVARGVAGAFQYDILQGGSVDELVAWLNDNNYQQDEDAPDILADYLAEDYLFVAVKLQSGAGIDEIQPLVLDYEGEAPCIPLRLTAIAAADDMPVRAFFMGETRTVPTNYQLVEPNWARMDWDNLGADYNELISLAIDEADDGHGWVTEYAGTSSLVSPAGLLGPTWSALAFLDINPIDVVDRLSTQGLIFCDQNGGCSYEHPLVEPLLNEYLPVPEGVSDDAFYACLECHEALIDLSAWDAQAFSDAFDERIVKPGERAVEILDDHGYLTRLFTTLSPQEMTLDPTFHTNADLGDVATQSTAVQHFECELPNWWETPNGFVVHTDSDGIYPALSEAPAAHYLYRAPVSGALMEEADNTEAIQDVVDAWNKANPLHDEGNDCALSPRRGARGWVMLAFILGFAGYRRRRPG